MVRRAIHATSAKPLSQRRQSKELVIIPGATHTDLYDQLDAIPFDKLTGFLNDHLAI